MVDDVLFPGTIEIHMHNFPIVFRGIRYVNVVGQGIVNAFTGRFTGGTARSKPQGCQGLEENVFHEWRMVGVPNIQI
jgi:hypothetical protein